MKTPPLIHQQHGALIVHLRKSQRQVKALVIHFNLENTTALSKNIWRSEANDWPLTSHWKAYKKRSSKSWNLCFTVKHHITVFDKTGGLKTGEIISTCLHITKFFLNSWHEQCFLRESGRIRDRSLPGEAKFLKVQYNSSLSLPFRKCHRPLFIHGSSRVSKRNNSRQPAASTV